MPLYDDKYFYLPKAFSSKPVEMPQGDDMVSDTKFPQLSSKAYTHFVYRDIKEPRKFLPTYTKLDVNSEGLFALGTNDFTSPIVNGSFIGARDFETIVDGDIDKAAFVHPMFNSVTELKFVDDNMVS
jgi:hypothetical protein